MLQQEVRRFLASWPAVVNFHCPNMNAAREPAKGLFGTRCRTAWLAVLALSFAGLPSAEAQAAHPELPELAAPQLSYDATVLADKPSAYWTMGSPRNGIEKDRSGHGLTGSYFGRPAATRLPNGDPAADFDGKAEYLQVKDAVALSPATDGVLTIEAWMRPDSLNFPEKEGGRGYVHWMGKGEKDNHEYVARFYSRAGTDRPNRISGYLFNGSGGKGAGSYFEQKVRVATWIHYVLVINANAKSPTYPNGYIRIYRNGVRMDTTNLDYRGAVIVPQRGKAPFRVGTRDLGSFFEGAIGKVAIYGKELSRTRIEQHFAAMTRR